MTKNEKFEEAAKIEGNVTAKSEETRKIVKSGIATKYSVEELMKAADSRFEVPAECVKAAFLYAGKTGAAESEAVKIIKDFMTKEVK